jgi:spore coat polysaccharide biosynthesis protein SpsF (cytidylyltransferase family)
VLQHVIRRALFFKLDPIVCTTHEAADDVIEEIVKREKVRCFRGDVTHKLKRWRDACHKFKITAFHSVDADDPFFDGVLAERSFALLQQGYDVVYPCETTYMGSVGFSLTCDIITKACELTASRDTEMMWYYLEQVPDLRRTTLEVRDTKEIKARLTLDYEEDYWLLNMVQRIGGVEASRSQIEELFFRNPDLYKINWFRNEEWKQGQLAKKIE